MRFRDGQRKGLWSKLLSDSRHINSSHYNLNSSSKCLELHSIEIEQAFLQADKLLEGVNGRYFINPPPGSPDANNKDTVYEVMRPLYENPSSPRALDSDFGSDRDTWKSMTCYLMSVNHRWVTLFPGDHLDNTFVSSWRGLVILRRSPQKCGRITRHVLWWVKILLIVIDRHMSMSSYTTSVTMFRTFWRRAWHDQLFRSTGNTCGNSCTLSKFSFL